MEAKRKIWFMTKEWILWLMIWVWLIWSGITVWVFAAAHTWNWSSSWNTVSLDDWTRLRNKVEGNWDMVGFLNYYAVKWKSRGEEPIKPLGFKNCVKKAQSRSSNNQCTDKVYNWYSFEYNSWNSSMINWRNICNRRVCTR